jgi:hypothetical protein
MEVSFNYAFASGDTCRWKRLEQDDLCLELSYYDVKFTASCPGPNDI